MQPIEPSRQTSARRIDRPGPLRDRVRDAMQELIISRQLSPGQHLVESELAEMLGVSRQPIREALQLLNSEGWVELHPGYGAFVHSPTDSEVDQLLAVRAALESESARLATARVDADGIAHLRKLCADGEAALQHDNPDSVVNANAELHRYITELSGNQVLLDFLSQVDRRVRWYFTPVAQVRGYHSWQEHARLVDAIEKGDSQLAAQIMREHTDRTREVYLTARDQNAEPEEQPRQIRKRWIRTKPSTS